MSGTGPGQLPVYCENPQDWNGIVARLLAAGHELAMTPGGITALVSAGVSAMFQADATGRYDGLHQLFADPVVAVLARRPGEFQGAVPQDVAMQLIGAPEGHNPNQAEVRVRLQINVQAAGPVASGPEVLGQFWDIAQTQTVTTTVATCPNCGAPIEAGSAVCRFCGTDARQVVTAPLAVVRLQLY